MNSSIDLSITLTKLQQVLYIHTELFTVTQHTIFLYFKKYCKFQVITNTLE